MRRSITVVAGALIGVFLLISFLFLQQPKEEDEEDVFIQPSLYPPDPIILPNLTETFSHQRINGNEEIYATRFVDCTLEILNREEVKISYCELVNSQVIISNSCSIEISNNIIRDHYAWENPTVNVYNTINILIHHNQVENNSIGIAVGGSTDVDVSYNIFEANDQHNALAIGNTSADIHNNLFKHNFPHAILAMNRVGNPEVEVNIYSNIFEYNIEDAINFEDFSGSHRISKVFNNRITGTGWAGLNVEYNSWNANIIITNNYIDNNGLLTQDILDQSGKPTSIYPAHEHQTEPYGEGWKHGIKIEDSSGVTVKNNIIIDNKGNGVDIINARDISVVNNTITRNNIGISVMKYLESSMYREYSPLPPESAGFSILQVFKNSVYGNVEEDWSIEEGCTIDEGRSPIVRFNGVWLPFLREVQIALNNIVNLKLDGVNTVAIGIKICLTDAVMECEDEDEIINAIREFHKNSMETYILLNPAHPDFTANQSATGETGKPLLDELTPLVLKWAAIAEENNVYLFSPLNEPQLLSYKDPEAVSLWVQELLPQIREIYTGKVGFRVHSDPSGFAAYNLTGYDYVVFSGLACTIDIYDHPDWIEHMIDEKTQSMKTAYPDCQSILFDMGAFTGPDYYWWEPIAPENVHYLNLDVPSDFFTLTSEGQAQFYDMFFRLTWNETEGYFIPIYKGWEYRDKPAEETIREWFNTTK